MTIKQQTFMEKLRLFEYKVDLRTAFDDFLIMTICSFGQNPATGKSCDEDLYLEAQRLLFSCPNVNFTLLSLLLLKAYTAGKYSFTKTYPMAPITKDIFEIVTTLIIEKLEQGVVPWKQPWKHLGPPRNLVTQRPYRGMNHLLLNALGYPSNEFLTWKQVQDLGGRVRKGEKAHLVILWVWIEEEETVRRQEVKGRKRPVLRYYFVFNVSQCTGIPERANPLPPKQHDPIETCETIVANMPKCPKIVHNENEAYYFPYADFINMPKMATFEAVEGYYATLFHELIHSTGHEDRLNRKELTEPTNFGSDLYSIEELTAEIGACYLTTYAGIAMNGLSNNVAYIHGWLQRLKKDKKFIVYASAHAQKAVDYILNIKHDDQVLSDNIKEEETWSN